MHFYCCVVLNALKVANEGNKQKVAVNLNCSRRVAESRSTSIADSDN